MVLPEDRLDLTQGSRTGALRHDRNRRCRPIRLSIIMGNAACDVLQTVTSRLQTQHPQALLLTSIMTSIMPPCPLPTFSQYVTCHTRDNKILHLFYDNPMEAYTSSVLPSLGWSDYNLVHLLPLYKPLICRLSPAQSRDDPTRLKMPSRTASTQLCGRKFVLHTVRTLTVSHTV